MFITRTIFVCTFFTLFVALGIAQQSRQGEKVPERSDTKREEAKAQSETPQTPQSKQSESASSKSNASDKTTGSKTPAAKRITPDVRRALDIVENVYAVSRGFDDERARIKAQARAADLLWDYDEARARRFFEEAFHSIETLKVTVPPVPQGEMAFLAMLAGTPQTQLRSEVLRFIARRDAKLAAQLIETLPQTAKDARKDETQNKSDESGAVSTDTNDADQSKDAKAKKSNAAAADKFLRSLSPFGDPQRERATYFMQLAANLVDVDTARAADFARRGLQEGGLNLLFPSVLYALRLKDPNVSDALYNDALNAARRDSSNLQFNISLLAPYALPNYGDAAKVMRSMLDINPQLKAMLTSNTNVAANFLEFAYGALAQDTNAVPTSDDAMSVMSAQTNLQMLRQLLPFYEKYLPARADAVRQRLDEKMSGLSNAERDELTKNERETTISELTQKAEKAKTPMEKDLYYRLAAMKALSEGDEGASLDLIEKIADATQREMFRGLVRVQAATRAVGKGDLEKALRNAREIEEPFQRASIFAIIAQKFVEKKETTRATAIVDEVLHLTEKMDDGEAKTQTLLLIAASVARIDSPRGFEVIRAAINSLNNTEFKTSRTDEEKGEKKSEKKSNTAEAARAIGGVMGIDLFDFDASFGTLAGTDFEHAVALAQSIQKKETSAFAQLAACRGKLNPLLAKSAVMK